MLKKIIFLLIALALIVGVTIGVKEGVLSKDGISMGKKPVDAKKGVENFEQTAKDFARPYYEKMKLTDEQMKLHNEGMAKIAILTKPIVQQRTVVSDEHSKVYNSALSEAEKKAKADKLDAEMNDLNLKYDAITAKTMTTFVAALTPEQKEIWTKYQEALAKKFGAKKK